MDLLRRISSFDAHHRLAIACGASIGVFLLIREPVSLTTKLIAMWNAFAFTELSLAWTTILRAHHAQLRKTADQQDLSRAIIFVMAIIAACTSLLAVGLLLGPARGLPQSHRTGHIVLSVLAVIGSWCLVHTVFTFRYAHLFYRTPNGTRSDKRRSGVLFPHESQPDYLDFAYFAFVIGMTCQVSDVQITSRLIRRLALLHGVLSFAFNTVVLALSVNLIAGLL